MRWFETSLGKILYAVDHGTVWQLFYELDQGEISTLTFDHRPFASFYEGATGRSFFDDYAFGKGREYISKNLQGRRIAVEGEIGSQIVELEND